MSAIEKIFNNEKSKSPDSFYMDQSEVGVPSPDVLKKLKISQTDTRGWTEANHVSKATIRKTLFECSIFLKIIEEKLTEGRIDDCVAYQMLLTEKIMDMTPVFDAFPSNGDDDDDDDDIMRKEKNIENKDF